MRRIPFVFVTLLFSTATFAEPINIKVQVRDWFGVRSGYGLEYRVNVPMPDGAPWSLTCERGISPGTIEGTYHHEKNKLRLKTEDLKGKAQITKCEVFSHDWRAPAR